MYPFWNQLDPQFAGVKLGDTKFLLSRYGCLMCSICTLMVKHGSSITPYQAARKWQFNADGLLCWNNDFWPLVYKGRYYEYDEKSLRTWLANGGEAVIQVNGSHWLAVDRFSIIGLNAIDPLGGVSCRVKAKYAKITGMAYFEVAKPKS